MNEDPRLPRRGERPRFAPVVFDDADEYEDDPYDYDDEGYDEEPPGGDPPPRPPRRGGRGPGNGRGGSGQYASDAGLFRVMALIAFLGFVILALVLPWSPVSVVGGGGDGGDDGIATSARDDLPNLPPGLVALSKMYDIEVPDGMEGPWTIEVRLDEQTEDPRNLAYYAYEDGRWRRLTSVELVGEGGRVSGVLSETPGSIAVLRREATAADLGLIIDAGDEPDTAALNSATAMAIRGAVVQSSGELELDADAVAATRGGAGAVPVYLGITGMVDTVLAAPAALTTHVEAIAQAVEAGDFAGAYLEYTDVPASMQADVTTLVDGLAARLGEEYSVLVGVPADGSSAYNWASILAVADGIWLRPPADPTTYYEQVESVLAAQLSEGVDLRQVSLVLDRWSTQQSPAGNARITLQGALTAASAVDRGIEGGIATGDPVTLRAVNLETNPAGAALQWDPATRMVTYAFTDGDGQSTVWIENRFSAAFRMEVAQRYGLGGVIVDPAAANPQLPAFWESVIAFIEEGEVTLEQPYGPYLVPCWEASAGDIEGASECWASSDPADAVVWRAPAQPGVYDIRLIVSDGTVFVAQELALNVAVEATATPIPTATAPPEPTETEVPEPEPTETLVPEPTQTEVPEPTETQGPEPEPEPTEEVPPGPAGDDEESE